jgi:tRNA threonylcarbamoyladenosine modification (KEOPS) complex Cgi121 subunit
LPKSAVPGLYFAQIYATRQIKATLPIGGAKPGEFLASRAIVD